MALTLRLDETENLELEKIKKTLSVSTSSAAIKKMIMDYHRTKETLIKYQKESLKLQQEQAIIMKEMDNYFQAQNNLSRLVYGEPNQTTIDAFNEKNLEPVTVNELRKLCQ